MAYIFPENMCPSGHTAIPFTMILPENLPQTIFFVSELTILYELQAQAVPVYISDVTDKYGRCDLRC